MNVGDLIIQCNVILPTCSERPCPFPSSISLMRWSAKPQILYFLCQHWTTGQNEANVTNFLSFKDNTGIHFRIIVGLKQSWGWDAIPCWRLVKNGVYYNPPLTQSRRKKNEATCFGWSLTLSWWWEKYRQHSSECSVRCSAHCTKMQDKKTAEIWWNFIPNCI